MQINLLSILSSSSEAAAPNALGTAIDPEAGEALAAATPEQFDQLFEGKLTEMTPEGAELLPTPKLMAAFLQRLHLVSPEAEGLPTDIAPALPELTTEQLEAMARVLGVDPAALQLNRANSAEQIFPPGEGLQHESVTGLLSVLRELAELGQALHQKGLTLVDVSAAGQSELKKGSIANLISTPKEVPAVQEFELSDESIGILAQLFGVVVSEIQENLESLRLVPIDPTEIVADLGVELNFAISGDDIEEKAKAPGLLQLLARILDKPVEEVWEQLEMVTDGEADLPFGVVLSAFVKETSHNALLAFNRTSPASEAATAGLEKALLLPAGSAELAARAGRQVVGSEVASGARVAGMVPLAESKQESRLANSSQPFSVLKGEGEGDRFEPLPRMNDRPDAQVVPAEAARRNNVLSAQAREVNPRAAALLRQNSVQPLLRESAERPIETRGTFESSSSLALSASDSKLDFDAKLREARSFKARAHLNPNSVRDQVAVQVKQGIEKGDTNINIRLRPHELGRVDVRVEVAIDGRTTLAIVAENRDTLEMLQRDSRSLEKAFADLGMDMSDSGMSFDLQEQFAGDQQEREESASSNPQAEEESLDAMMASPDEMIAEALLDGSQVNYMVGVDDSLNIKV
ncbi:MAG: flagellar hook-length control protein FliK [Rickettsiales bacterium]|nr:flagellar hook-length control protein FliK [Rickettsiales bacterium]